MAMFNSYVKLPEGILLHAILTALQRYLGLVSRKLVVAKLVQIGLA